MNNKFDGQLRLQRNKKPKGYCSEAAKAAFHDILHDKSMKVSIEVGGVLMKISMILNESILNPINLQPILGYR